ncbi:hypothetical protein BO71DRAFT_155858 [Aspergillus ellipticus CBS 707.79]|uniref:Uncharacterized protein n=1 Tax=Aspergillus ellipticus CBS 707.79 TaxID=1448320 RepID=A0A319CU54_9EURO|nr:hypothetical protein BO71DRAFT_155858 [Aspergillus ellipticus CBS 707.79]
MDRPLAPRASDQLWQVATQLKLAGLDKPTRGHDAGGENHRSQPAPPTVRRRVRGQGQVWSFLLPNTASVPSFIRCLSCPALPVPCPFPFSSDAPSSRICTPRRGCLARESPPTIGPEKNQGDQKKKKPRNQDGCGGLQTPTPGCRGELGVSRRRCLCCLRCRVVLGGGCRWAISATNLQRVSNATYINSPPRGQFDVSTAVGGAEKWFWWTDWKGLDGLNRGNHPPNISNVPVARGHHYQHHALCDMPGSRGMLLVVGQDPLSSGSKRMGACCVGPGKQRTRMPPIIPSSYHQITPPPSHRSSPWSLASVGFTGLSYLSPHSHVGLPSLVY